MRVKARAASDGMVPTNGMRGLQVADPLVETMSEPCPIKFQRWPTSKTCRVPHHQHQIRAQTSTQVA
jgi:hypothetical protein